MAAEKSVSDVTQMCSMATALRSSALCIFTVKIIVAKFWAKNHS
jgi:hypothetical protein